MDKKTAEKIIKSHGEDHDKVHNKTGGKYIGDVVYGANDGIITTFAMVSAVTGAALSPLIVLIIGLANLFADGFSMAAGDYLAVKSKKDYYERQRKIEEWEIENIPEQERKEVVEIYRRKGFTGTLLDKAVDVITGNKKTWVDTMLQEELNLSPVDGESPFKKGFATFVAFVFAGFMPLIPYAFGIEPEFIISMIIAGITLFIIGSLRSIVTARNWFKSGFEMLLIGAIAGTVAYLVGWLIGGLTSIV